MSSRTLWHRILGKLLELLLTPKGVLVQTDFEVMRDPPRIDILLLRRDEPQWTAAQRALLPDGIRDSQAQQILVEFKYSESLNRERLRKVQGYAAFYREAQRLKAGEMDCFIVSAKTPQRKFLKTYSYSESDQSGVFYSDNPLLADIPLLTLNGLSDTLHNAYLKCFASRQVERTKAFQRLVAIGFNEAEQDVKSYLMGLRQTFGVKGEKETMKHEITPEDVMELGEEWRAFILETISLEEMLSKYEPEEVLSWYKPQEVLSRYRLEERLAGMEDYLAAQQQKAKQEALVASLMRILQIRFDLSPEKVDAYREQCQPLDPEMLEKLEEVALKVTAFAEFDTALAELLPPEQKPT